MYLSSATSTTPWFNCFICQRIQYNLTFDVLNSNTVDFFCRLCGHHPWALVMDLNKKIAFKCSINELENISDADENDIYGDTVNVALFWEKVEKTFLLHVFPGRAICELNLKPNFKE